MTNTPEHDRMTPDTPDDADRREVLITRVVDGAARVRDWDELDRLSSRDPGLWRDLAMSQRQHAAMSAAVGEAEDRADRIVAPIDEVLHFRLAERSRRVSAWGGWAAAAAVGLAWLGVPMLRPATPTGTDAPATAGVGLVSAGEALQQYLSRGAENGTVLGEVPGKLIVDARPAADGRGYEVTYLRQIVEREVVPTLYGSSVDESGRAVPSGVPVRLTPRSSGAM